MATAIVCRHKRSGKHACQAGATGDFFFEDLPGDLDQYGWYLANSKLHTHPVGTLKANPFGLYDVHGNVWEWCQDQPSAVQRIAHGGSWSHEASKCSTMESHEFGSTDRGTNGGFRVVRVITVE